MKKFDLKIIISLAIAIVISVFVIIWTDPYPNFEKSQSKLQKNLEAQMKLTLTPLMEMGEQMDMDDLETYLYITERCTAVYLLVWKWTREAPKDSWVRMTTSLNLGRDFENDLNYLRTVSVNMRAIVDYGDMSNSKNQSKAAKVFKKNYEEILDLYTQPTKQLFFGKDWEWNEDLLSDYLMCNINLGNLEQLEKEYYSN